LLFFKAAIEKSWKAVLIYPSVRMSISPLLALEALYYRLHEKKLPSGRNRLVIISSRVELRKEIRDHFIAFKAGSMPLYIDAFPIGRVTSKGEVVKALSKTGEPKLLISPGSAALPNDAIARGTFCVLIEATLDLKLEQAKRIFKWAQIHEIPFLFVVSPDPPTELPMHLIEKKYLYWGWEHSSLEEDCKKDEQNLKAKIFDLDQPFCGNYREIQNKALGVRKVIVPVKERKLNEMLNSLREDYWELAKSARSIESSSATEVAKRFLGCIYALEEMTSPLAYAEIELGKRWGTIPINRRIAALKNHCEAVRTEQPLFASFAARSADKVLEAYRYMAETKTGKHPIILQIIKEASANGKTVLFISKNEALNEGLKAYLEIEKGMSISELKSQGIDFIPTSRIYRNVVDANPIDTCILYGCPRYYQRDIFSYTKARNIGIIAYESEIPAIKYIQSEFDEMQSLFCDSHKQKVAERLFGMKVEARTRKLISKDTSKKTELIFIDPQDAEMGSFSPEAIFSDFLSLDWRIDFDYSNEAEAKSADQRLGKELSDSIDAAKISLPGGRHILLHAEKLVQIYDESTEKVKDRLVRNIKKGDLLILIENSTRKSLAESVISKVEAHPSMMEVVVYQRAWAYYLREALGDSRDNFIEVIKKLHKLGANTPTTPAAVFHWVNGAIIGPQDLENIRRIGIIYDKPFLVNKFRDIASAVQRLRRIHRSLSLRLSKLIPRAGIEADQEHCENTVIDEELELYLEDFANIVSIERVEDVKIISDVSPGDLDRVTFN